MSKDSIRNVVQTKLFWIAIFVTAICSVSITILWLMHDYNEPIEEETEFEIIEDLLYNEGKRQTDEEITHFIENHQTYLNDETLNELEEIRYNINNAIYASEYHYWLNEYHRIAEPIEQQKIDDENARLEEEARQAEEEQVVYTYYEPSYSAPQQEGVLTAQGGVNYYNGVKETYYSQKVLPGGGLDIPGRHVEPSDGTVRDGDGYIVVAASDKAKGEVVETSLGTGKVYDTGYMGANHLDIYTDW